MQKGLGVSGGIAIGNALIYHNRPVVPSGRIIAVHEIAAQQQKVYDAIQSAQDELQEILAGLDQNDKMMVDMIALQIALTSDPLLLEKIVGYIKHFLHDATDAILLAADELAKSLEVLENEYYRARAIDVRDIGGRLAAHASGVRQVDFSKLEKPVIIFTEDITPSEIVTMDKANVLAFVTQMGSTTSHTAILARMLELPAVAGISDAPQNDTMVIVDGTAGEVILNPTQAEVLLYQNRRIQLLEDQNRLNSLRELPAKTADEHQIKLYINIASPEECGKMEKVGGDGIGLFRTELLFLNSRQLPTEEEQYAAYRAVAIDAKAKPVIIRTLDVGSDKNSVCLPIYSEANPALGYRGIRCWLDDPALHMPQLRAILRASVFGKLKILLPMISSISELRQAKRLIARCMAELDTQSLAYDKNIAVGIMVEIPSVAVSAEFFAREVDFFSIGTNDLCQYALAVDRVNSQIAGLYDPFDPGVLRLIQMAIQAGNAAGIPVEICGEMAADRTALPLLLGLELTEFSINPPSLPYIKDALRHITMEKARKIAQKALCLGTAFEVRKYLQGIQYS